MQLFILNHFVLLQCHWFECFLFVLVAFCWEYSLTWIRLKTLLFDRWKCFCLHQKCFQCSKSILRIYFCFFPFSLQSFTLGEKNCICYPKCVNRKLCRGHWMYNIDWNDTSMLNTYLCCCLLYVLNMDSFGDNFKILVP